jgi:tetratricopeptide (TPR) repeat protein
MRQEALEIFRSIGDRIGEAIGLGHLGEIALHVADSAKARDYFEQCLAIARSIDHLELEGECELFLGELSLQAADLPAARERFARSLEVAKDSENKRGEASRSGGSAKPTWREATARVRALIWARHCARSRPTRCMPRCWAASRTMRGCGHRSDLPTKPRASTGRGGGSGKARAAALRSQREGLGSRRGLPPAPPWATARSSGLGRRTDVAARHGGPPRAGARDYADA